MSGGSPHEAFFTPDGREVWVSVREARITSPCWTARRLHGERAGSRCRTGRAWSSSRPTASSATSSVELHARDGRDLDCRRTRSSGTGEAGQPVRARRRRDAGWQAGLADAEGCGPHDGVQRRRTVQRAEGARHRPDHQPRQHRPQRAWAVRLCDGRWAEPNKGVPHRRFQPGGDDRRRRAAAWHLALRRRHASLCGAGERGRLPRSSTRSRTS